MLGVWVSAKLRTYFLPVSNEVQVRLQYLTKSVSAHVRSAARSAYEAHYYESATNGLHAHSSRLI